MNTQMFKAMLRWVLLSLCIMHSSLTTTHAAAAEYKFPSVFPVGTNINELLRQRVDTLTMYGYIVYTVNDIHTVIDLTKLSVEANSNTSNDQIQRWALPVLKGVVRAGVEHMNNYLGNSDVRVAQVVFTTGLFESNITELFTSYGRVFYVVRNEATNLFEADEVSNDTRFDQWPSYMDLWGEKNGQYRYFFPKTSDLVQLNTLIDAVDADGMPVTLSSYDNTLYPQRSVVNVPEWVVDGSLTGTMYLEIASSKPNSDSQLVAIDLQSGRVDRPKIKYVGTRFIGPAARFDGDETPLYVVQPKYIVPRGTALITYIRTNLMANTWIEDARYRTSGSSPTLQPELVSSIFSFAPQMITKTVVDDTLYPLSILKVLPPLK